jgi:hypothetical protein
MPMAGGTVLQVDQAALAHQALLRHFRKRRATQIWIAISVYVLVAIIKKRLRLDVSYRIEGNTNSGYPRPEKYLAIMLGLVGLGGFIFLCKGIYGESEIMVLSGWVIAAIAAALGAMWIMSGHVPFISENAAVSFGASGASATTYRS